MQVIEVIQNKLFKPVMMTCQLPFALRLLVLCGFCTLLSCTVQNNLYINQPFPLEKGTAEFYTGLGTGLQPKVDSIGFDGFVYFTEEMGWAPNLALGANVGITERFDLGVDLHLPYLIGGFGMNVRPQFSFFSAASDFNIALAGRAGFVVSKDELELGENFSIDVTSLQAMRGSLNASVALPIGFRIGEEAQFILTPRLSRTSFAFWENATFQDRVIRRGHTLHILSFGARFRKVHFEATIIKLGTEYLPHFGLVYCFEVE